MKNRIMFALAMLVVIGLTSLRIVPLEHSQESQEKQFALLMKVSSPEFFKKIEEPQGQRLVGEHFKRLQTLTKEGVIIFSGRSLNQDDTGFGIIVVRAESESAARKVIDEDQLVKAGLVSGTVFPFQIITSQRDAGR